MFGKGHTPFDVTVSFTEDNKKASGEMPAPASVKANSKKSKVIVTWKKIRKTKKNEAVLSQIRKIQIQYSTDPSFRQNLLTKTVGVKKTKLILKGLSKKVAYYIRVRYVGNNCTSKWSNPKRVITK